MKYTIENGIYNLNYELSLLEKKLFREFEDMLDTKGFRYLSIPSLTRWNSFERQGIEDIVKSLSVDHVHNLSGSAEQGILQYFSDSIVEPQLIYSKNQCFRHENYGYEGLKRCKEFVKLEQFCFCNDYDWKEKFELLLSNATSFLDKHNIEFRVVDVTKLDFPDNSFNIIITERCLINLDSWESQKKSLEEIQQRRKKTMSTIGEKSTAFCFHCTKTSLSNKRKLL